MSCYQSVNAAARLNDLLAIHGWHRRGVRVFPTSKQWEVEVQYKSEVLGAVRVVTCDPQRLFAWIKNNVATPGCWVRFQAFLDRKNETVKVAETMLFPSSELAPPVRRSMTPNE